MTQDINYMRVSEDDVEDMSGTSFLHDPNTVRYPEERGCEMFPWFHAISMYLAQLTAE
jgi:hypothetical protein